MRQKLKKFFETVSKKSNHLAMGASAIFAFGFGPARAVAQETPENGKPSPTNITQFEQPKKIGDGATYWKHKDYDMVVKVEPDQDNGLRATIYSVNPDDANNKYLMAQLKGYGKRVRDNSSLGRGAPAYRIVPDPDAVQRWEIEAYCGFEPEIKLKKKNDNTWSGTIVSPFNGGTYGLDIKQMNDGQLKVYGYLTGFPLIKLSEKASRVENPPAEQCRINWPDP